jgi:hypothetical protein
VRDLDLHLRIEEGRALQVAVGWQFLRGGSQRTVQRVSYGGDRRGRVSLRQTHQGETGLGFPAQPMRGQEGLLGAVDVALAQPDQPELAERPSQLPTQVRAQLLAGHQRLSLCLVARAAQSQDLGAVHAAAPMQAPDGVRPAPPFHRLGPFLGDVVLRESLQRTDDLAVHESRRERIEVPGDGCHPRLVEQGQTFLDIAAEDAQPRRRHPSDRARRRIAPGADLDRALGPVASLADVAGQHPFVRADDREPRVRGLLLLAFEQAFRSAEPAAHRRHQRGVQEQMHRDANGRVRRRHRVTGLDAQGVRTLPRLDGHVEMAGRVCDLAEQPQISGTREPFRRGLHQDVIGLLPFAPRRRFARALDAHHATP